MPMMTNSEVSYAKHTLPYPVYTADWDPYNRGYIVVAGGGGEGRSGVPNQISLLDVKNRAAIEPVAEIDLSRDEDSVSSLATLATKDGLITFAGINSSQKEQDAGNNEHLRSFGIQYPPRKKQKTEESKSEGKGLITPLGKRSLFKASSAAKKETYQRLLRLSPVQSRDAPSKRIGAVASGLAAENEIIIFDATVALPHTRDVITRIDLPEKSEAADLDVAQIDTDEFSITYCDDHNIYEQTIKYDFDKKTAQKQPKGPRRVHQMLGPDSFQAKNSQPKYRCLRFLNSQNVVTLINKPNKSGAELRIYHLYPTGPALEMTQKNLPSRLKQATSLDVCALDADKNGNQQFVIAVAGQDMSIEVYTVNYQAATDSFSGGFKGYLTLRDVHPQQMTKLAWAPFYSPPRAPNPADIPTTGPNGEPLPPRQVSHPGPQYVRLASVSFGNTLVIDTFPLTPLTPKNKDSRYVLGHPNDERFWKFAYILVISFVVLITAFLYQSFTVGFADNPNGIFGLLPQNIRDYLDAPAGVAYGRTHVSRVVSSTSTSTSTSTVSIHVVRATLSAIPTDNLLSAIAEHHGSPEDAQATAVIVRDDPDTEDGVDVHVHPDKEKYLENDMHAKHWHELEDHQQTYWKEKLKKAGQWAESEGESVLKGVLWSTYAGIVGQVGGEILREL